MAASALKDAPTDRSSKSGIKNTRSSDPHVSLFIGLRRQEFLVRAARSTSRFAMSRRARATSISAESCPAPAGTQRTSTLLRSHRRLVAPQRIASSRRRRPAHQPRCTGRPRLMPSPVVTAHQLPRPLPSPAPSPSPPPSPTALAGTLILIGRPRQYALVGTVTLTGRYGTSASSAPITLTGSRSPTAPATAPAAPGPRPSQGCQSPVAILRLGVAFDPIARRRVRAAGSGTHAAEGGAATAPSRSGSDEVRSERIGEFKTGPCSKLRSDADARRAMLPQGVSERPVAEGTNDVGFT